MENVRSFGPEGWGYSEGGQIKTNFSLFSFVCVCVCVCVCVSVKYFWRVKHYRRWCFLKKCGYPGLFVDAM